MRTTTRRNFSIISFLLLIAWSQGAAAATFTESSAAAGVNVSHAAIGLFDRWDYLPGGAVGDFNNDGWQDIFMISGGVGGIPDRLFINNQDGTFTDRAVQSGLTRFHLGKGAAVGDFNNDGFLDLYVTSVGDFVRMGPGHHKLYRNNGDGTFSNIALAAGVAFSASPQYEEDGFGAAFGDYDLDGDLDLFVAGFRSDNVGSRLFRNNGDETFTDVTAVSGPGGSDLYSGTTGSLRVFAPRFIDMDGDRYPELLLAADFGTSAYFRNNGDGTFTDITVSSATSQEENGMGQTVGDFNGDGLMDWYVTSIHLPINNWTGNKLYLNQGGHVYTESSVALGVDDGGYGWSAVAVDFDHDGRLDLAETNGSTGFQGVFDNEPAYLWLQQPNGTFTESSFVSGFTHTGLGRGMSNLDYDNDGDQDVVIFSLNEPLTLLRNDLSGPNTNWVRIFLDTSAQPGLAPNGVGAKVSVTSGGQTQVRMVTGGDNFLSNSELSAHFGLGNATSLTTLRVDWPDGTTTILNNVTANRTMVVAAGPRETDCSDLSDNDQDGQTDCDDTDCCGQAACSGGQGVCCVTAASCDDSVFCNGTEQCVDSVCVSDPDASTCPGQQCDEPGGICVQCLTDTDCDDAVHCNGVETCSAGVCLAGSDPCPSSICDEFFNTCFECQSHSDCPDDGIFCNGAEICNRGVCDSARDSCVGQLCDEDNDMCIGTGSLQPRIGMPLARLTEKELAQFEAGKAEFLSAVSEPAGLGPIYNADNCAACHQVDLAGVSSATVTRFGEDDLQGGVLPLPGGPLLQTLATSGTCAENLPVSADVTTLQRSIGLAGLGLIQQVPDSTLQQRAYSPPAGVTGRVQVAEILEEPGETAVGRLGWKSSTATILTEVAGQSRDHLGYTSRLLPIEAAPNDDQILLGQCDTVADPEDGPDVNGLDYIDRVSTYVRLLAQPPATPRGGMTGAGLLNQIGCEKCHSAAMFTNGDTRLESALIAQFILPYSDFLLHDMGANGDPMPAGLAAPGEMRTPPLWGVRVRDPMWHDGRFAGGTFETRVTSAIAAHDSAGSEGQAAAQAFFALSGGDQDAIVAFLDSLGRAEFDHDGDNDVDGDDFVTFNSCFTGSGVFYTADDPCSISDVDQDGDVDADDQLMFEVAADGPAGEVPAGSLLLEKLAGNQLRLSWNPSCSAGDTDYGIYEGVLGTFTGHAAIECTTSGLTQKDVGPAAGDSYYLVVPATGFREGSYGTDSGGNPRAQNTGACLFQALGGCN